VFFIRCDEFVVVIAFGMFERDNACRTLRDRLSANPTVSPSCNPALPCVSDAMTLSGGEYAIRGTNAPGSVGGFVS
jgi:hypothetical protein